MAGMPNSSDSLTGAGEGKVANHARFLPHTIERTMTTISSNESNGNAVAEQAVQQSRTFLDRQADALTSMLAERVAALAGDLRTIRGQPTDSRLGIPTSQLAEQAAKYTERVAQYLRDADGERLMTDAEHLAERNPVLASGVAIMAGLTAARFLKTSARSRRSYYGASMPHDGI
jgi:hypothetical protein